MKGSGAVSALLVVLSAGGLRAAVAGRRRATAASRARAIGGGGAVSCRRQPALPLLTPPHWLLARLADTGLAVAPATAWTAWVGIGGTATCWALLAVGGGAGAAAAVVALAAPCLGWRLLRHRGAAGLEAALPAAVEAMAAALRSGASLRQAVGEAAPAAPPPLGADLEAVAAATERGAGVVAALEGWAVRRPLPGVRLVVAALCLSAETGGTAARAVDAVAVTLRQRLAAQAEARALATQARVSAAVIAVAPVAFCALSTAADPRSSAFLLRTPVGLALLAAGLGLDAAGALWMARLTRVEA